MARCKDAAFAITAWALLLLAPAQACELRLVPWHINGTACSAVVGFYNGAEVGPFHVNESDGSKVYAGTCAGFIGVGRIDGNTLYLDAFKTMPPRVMSLSDDCKTGMRIR